MTQKKTLLSLAGYDPSGTAGLLLDVSVFQRLGFHGAGVVTAWTVQNTRCVERVIYLGAAQVEEQYRALAEDLRPAGLKVGMIGSRQNLRRIGRILSENAGVPRVIDPIFRASSGAWLLEQNAIPGFLASIRGRAAVITPNLGEASLLAGLPVKSQKDMRAAAKIIFDTSGIPCLIKGGHLKGRIFDLMYDGRDYRLYGHPRAAKSVRGTGCFLSASLLGFLAEGHALGRACGLAIGLTLRAIRGSQRPGRGPSVISFPL